MRVVCSLAAVFLLYRFIALASMRDGLRCGHAIPQKSALAHLQRYLSLRLVMGEGVVQDLTDNGILAALVQLLQPDTDACE